MMMLMHFLSLSVELTDVKNTAVPMDDRSAQGAVLVAGALLFAISG
jgi:hypothetical protein